MKHKSVTGMAMERWPLSDINFIVIVMQRGSEEAVLFVCFKFTKLYLLLDPDTKNNAWFIWNINISRER